LTPAGGLAAVEGIRAATATLEPPGADEAETNGAGAPDLAHIEDGEFADGPLVIRAKDHEAEPMTLDQALYEMELVGHDFFLFVDAPTGRPSVVYRRHGYHYGVIRLQVRQPATAAGG
jgi:hypothetical protein